MGKCFLFKISGSNIFMKEIKHQPMRSIIILLIRIAESSRLIVMNGRLIFVTKLLVLTNIIHIINSFNSGLYTIE